MMSAVGACLAIALAACSFRLRVGSSGDGPTASDVSADGLHDGSSAPADSAIPFCDANDSSLVACYQFEGTLADGSPNHLDPNVARNVSYGAGEVGMALVAGSTTEVDVAESSKFGVAALTIEGWINPSKIPSTGQRGGVLDCDGRYGFFLYASASVTCTAGGSASGGPIQPNRWTHVACTNDGSMIRVYVDGTLAQAAVATAPPLNGSQTGITLGGNNPPNGGDPLNGSLDQVRLYSAARSQAEICADAGNSGC